MFKIEVVGDRDELDRLGAVFEGLPESIDLLPLGQIVAGILLEDNVAARMLGVDKDGDAFYDVPGATINPQLADATFSFNPYRSAFEPPLIPMGVASRAISGFQVDVAGDPQDVLVTGSWPGFPELRFHVTGFTSRSGKWVYPRDIVGIRPEAWDRIALAFDEFVEHLLEPLRMA